MHASAITPPGHCPHGHRWRATGATSACRPVLCTNERETMGRRCEVLGSSSLALPLPVAAVSSSAQAARLFFLWRAGGAASTEKNTADSTPVSTNISTSPHYLSPVSTGGEFSAVFFSVLGRVCSERSTQSRAPYNRPALAPAYGHRKVLCGARPIETCASGLRHSL